MSSLVLLVFCFFSSTAGFFFSSGLGKIGAAVPEVSNWNSQFLISVPSLLVAVALIYVDPKTSVTFTVLSSTD